MIASQTLSIPLAKVSHMTNPNITRDGQHTRGIEIFDYHDFLLHKMGISVNFKKCSSFPAGTMESAEEKVLAMPETIKKKQKNFTELKL